MHKKLLSVANHLDSNAAALTYTTPDHGHDPYHRAYAQLQNKRPSELQA
jgi:hypothetical protein